MSLDDEFCKVCHYRFAMSGMIAILPKDRAMPQWVCAECADQIARQVRGKTEIQRIMKGQGG